MCKLRNSDKIEYMKKIWSLITKNIMKIFDDFIFLVAMILLSNLSRILNDDSELWRDISK